MLRYHNWHRIAIIRNAEDCYLIYPSVTEALRSVDDLQIVANVHAHAGNQTEIHEALEFVRDHARSKLYQET